MIRAEAVRAVVVGALPEAAPVTSIEPILQGFSSESFVVDSGLGRLVAKVGHPWADLEKWRVSARALDMARGAGVPAPELLAFVASVDALDGRVVRVFRYIEGSTPRVESAPLSLFGELGAALRTLHSIDVSTFTSRLGTEGFALWSEFLADRWPAVLDRAARVEIDPALVAHAHAASTELASDVDDVVTPALCHRDLYLDNVLVDDAGRLVALLDFDIVEVWDPVVDFFKPEWFIFEPNAAARRPFFAGYLDGDPLPARFDERLRLVSIIELLNHAANWRIQNQVEIAELALGRLSALLEHDHL